MFCPWGQDPESGLSSEPTLTATLEVSHLVDLPFLRRVTDER